MILVGVALAAPADRDLDATLRVIGTAPEAFALDPEGTTFDPGPILDTRLRARGRIGAEDDLRLVVEIDLFSGVLAGRTWGEPEIDERDRDERQALTVDGIVPRVAKVGARTRWLDVEGGFDTSHWGLGLLANDGDHEPLFGRSDFGDRVLRLRLASTPFRRDGGRPVPVFLLAAADAVMADELSRWSEGSQARQAVLGVLYATRERSAGLYGVLRDQDADDGSTTVGVVDAYGAATFGELRLAAEGALIVGSTSQALSYDAPDQLPVRAGGLGIRTSWGAERARVHANVALASGDRNASDNRVGDFRFDRDYDVGFVLFDELAAAIDLRAWEQATDPSVAAEPPKGVDTLAAEGAFHQALALQPAFTSAVRPWLELRAGLVFAWSTGPIAQPYQTFRNGGVPTNHLGVPTEGRWLGSELDYAAKITSPADGALRGSLGLQVGHAWPSAELAPDVGRLDHALLVATLAR